MQQVALFAGVGAATAKIVGGRRLRDGRQVENLKTGLVFEEIADEVVDMALSASRYAKN
jgi:hypothetical protein